MHNNSSFMLCAVTRILQTIGEFFTKQTLTLAVSFKWGKLRRWQTAWRRGPDEGKRVREICCSGEQGGRLATIVMSTAGIF